MMKTLRAVTIAASCGLGACSIHPLPEDVTGVNTETIVRKIRCEARDAVIRKALAYLEFEKYNFDKASFEKLNFSSLREPARSTLNYFAGTGIVYSFSLDGTESEGASLSSDIVVPFTHGGLTLSPSLGNSLTRDNIRAFTITDNFSDLVRKVDDSYCDFGPSSPNYEYPITGTIGIDEMIDTFIDLTLFNDLGGKSDIATAAKRGPPTMADTLTFTTTISAGLTPKVAFTPAGSGAYVQDASLPVSISRTDKHSVIVGLGLANAPVASNGLTANFVTASPSSAGETAAIQAVNQQIQRFEIPRPVIVAP